MAETLYAVIDADITKYRQNMQQVGRMAEQQSSRVQKAFDQTARSLQRVSTEINKQTQALRNQAQTANREHTRTNAILRQLVVTTERLGKEMRTATDRATQFGRESERAGQSGQRSFTLMQTAARGLIAVFAAGTLLRFTREIVTTAANMESLRFAFNAAAGDAQRGQREFAFIRAEAQRLGLELTTTATAYKGLLAATVASNRPSEVARVVFRGVAEAAAAMRLNAQDASLVFLAVQQIMSKGKVTAEELRQQLGERFPIAMGVMAQAIGKTTAELDKMLERGELTADVLVKFALELSRRYGTDLVDATNSATASFNRLTNAWTDFKDAIGQSGVLNLAADLAQALAAALRNLTALEAGFENIGKQDGVVLASLRIVKASLEGWVIIMREGARLLAQITGPAEQPSAIDVINQRIERNLVIQEQLRAQVERLTQARGEEAAATQLAQQRFIQQEEYLQELYAKRVDLIQELKQATTDAGDEAEKTRKAEEAAALQAAEAAEAAAKAAKTRADAEKEAAKEAKKRAEEAIRLAEREAEEGVKYAEERVKESIAAEKALTDARFEEIKKRLELERFAAEDQVKLDEERTQAQFRQIVNRVEAEQEALDAQQEAYEAFANSVASTLEDVLFETIKNGVDGTEDALESLKDTFLRIIARMAAEGLTTRIIIPILGQAGFAGGQGTTTGGGVFGSAQTGSGSVANRDIFGALWDTVLVAVGSGGGGQTTNIAPYGSPRGSEIAAGGYGAAGGFGGGFGAGAGAGAGAAGAGYGTGDVLGAIGTGVALGEALGTLAADYIGETGAAGRAGRALAYGTAGAVAGYQATGNPYVAAAGFVIGAIIGAAENTRRRRVLEIVQVDIPQFVDDALGIYATALFDVSEITNRRDRVGQGSVDLLTEGVNEYINDVFGQLVSGVQLATPDFQRALSGPLSAVAEDLARNLEGIILSKRGSGIGRKIDQFLNETLPQIVDETLGDFIERLARMGEVVGSYVDIVEALEAQRYGIERSFLEQRQALREALYTPGQLFESRREELQQLLTSFEGATKGERIALAPEIQQLIGEVFSLAQREDVLGQDMRALRNLQRELLYILDDVEQASLEAVDSQITLAERQLESLINNTALLNETKQVFDNALREANVYLSEIVNFLATGNAQPAIALLQGLGSPGEGAGAQPPEQIRNPAFQHGGWVGQTGPAWLHAGELVLPAAQAASLTTGGEGPTVIHAPITIDLHVDRLDSGQAQAISARMAETIAHRLERLSTYGHTQLVTTPGRSRDLRSTTARPVGS